MTSNGNHSRQPLLMTGERMYFGILPVTASKEKREKEPCNLIISPFHLVICVVIVFMVAETLQVIIHPVTGDTVLSA